MSWLVERDVRQGRDHMNFSRWPEYSFQQQEKLLADIATALKNREMPVPQYAVIHRDARLSDAEIDIVYQWARLERRRVKAAAPEGSAKPVFGTDEKNCANREFSERGPGTS
jgi:cytochrome c